MNGSAFGTDTKGGNDMCDDLLVTALKGREVRYNLLGVYYHLVRFLVIRTAYIKFISRRLVHSGLIRLEKHGRLSMLKAKSDNYGQFKHSAALSPPRHFAKLQPHAIRCFSRDEPSRIVRVPFPSKRDVVTTDQRGYETFQFRPRKSRKQLVPDEREDEVRKY